jgi:universal bacterial protein YeaZ
VELFIDTSASNLLVYILKNEKIVNFKIINDIQTLSTKALVTIDECLKECRSSTKEIKRIYVVTGPGSFTGLRVGLSIIKTMAYLLKIDVIPISSLEVLASTEIKTDLCIPYIDARRGYVYAGIYNGDLTTALEDQYIYIDELIKMIPKGKSYTFISNDNVIENTQVPVEEIERVIFKHKNDNPVNIHELKPNYLKKTEAEEKLGV